jgi:hypothetical protein
VEKGLYELVCIQSPNDLFWQGIELSQGGMKWEGESDEETYDCTGLLAVQPPLFARRGFLGRNE